MNPISYCVIRKDGGSGNRALTWIARTRGRTIEVIVDLRRCTGGRLFDFETKPQVPLTWVTLTRANSGLQIFCRFVGIGTRGRGRTWDLSLGRRTL